MPLATKFGPHIPMLRRYARALTGEQGSADGFIRAALQALVENPSEVDDDLPPKVALFRFFHAIWNSASPDNDDSIVSIEDLVSNRLRTLTPKFRQAYLLTSLEGFRPSETAKILDCSEADVEGFVSEAQREIENELRTNVLIIEDEAIIATDLEGIVRELGHTVTGNAVTRDEAVSMAKNDPPGLVLCDIKLADDSSGIDAANDILSQMDVPVIFITAYPERLLTGERPEPTYLISKPFQDETVKAAIAQALFFHPIKQPDAA